MIKVVPHDVSSVRVGRDVPGAERELTRTAEDAGSGGTVASR